MSTPYTLLYLDDLSVGLRTVTARQRITREDILAYARQFDPQPFHLDEEAARATLFQGLAASGWHVASLSMRLLVDARPFAGGIIGASGEIEWPRPTRPGDELRVESEVLEIIPSRSKPDRGIVRVRNQTLNQRDEAVQVLQAKLMVMRRPAVLAPADHD